MVDVQAQALVNGVALDLRDPHADDPAVVGAKAAKLAQAVNAGLPVLPGFALIAAKGRTFSLSPDDFVALYDVWADLSDNGAVPLIVRSSSTAEDGDSSSMAGLFESVLDVQGWTAFLDAVERVRRSGGAAPMGVLVQPLLRPVIGGVLFGADPVTGDHSREVVAVVEGGPDELVSGRATGTYHVLNRHGRLLGVRPGAGGAVLTADQRKALHRLARRLERQFGGPQDIEWAWDQALGLVLLQTRPITAGLDARRDGVGPLLGPGPVAETFPEPLSPLERDLWLRPLGEGLAEALVLAGVATRRRLSKTPVVRTVGGRAVVDLDVFGLAPPKHPVLHRFDPRPPARRLRAAWRVGRLRVAMPGLASDMVAAVDARLRAVPLLDTLDEDQLLGLLERVSRGLASVHGYEVLMGLVTQADGDGAASAAAEALRELADGRGRGATDDEIVRDAPVVLSLVPPRIGRPVELPPTAPITIVPTPALSTENAAAELREALRLRARWLVELSSRAAVELQRRLGLRFDIAVLTWDELGMVARGGEAPVDARYRRRPATPPLPTRFRLTEDGDVVASVGESSGHGTGAGGGRASGPVHHLAPGSTPPSGAVLVVQSLEPGLVAWLPNAAGVVAETGSPLSHFAILAREMGVPVVVGVAGARDRFEPGAMVVVDGGTGEVGAA